MVFLPEASCLWGCLEPGDFKHLSRNSVCQSPEAIAFELEADWTLIDNSPSGYSALLAAG